MASLIFASAKRHAFEPRYTGSTGSLSLHVHFVQHRAPTRVATQPAMFEGLRRLRLHQIQNVETVMQVDVALRSQGATLTDPMTPALAAKLEATALGLYGRSIAGQSGHVVTGIEVDARNAVTWKLDRLMNHYDVRLVEYADPVRARALHDRLLADHGVTRDATVRADFDLILLLEDAP